MSQLYQLFCQDLLSQTRKGKGLCSTLTSTPLEDEDEDDADFVQPPGVVAFASEQRSNSKKSPSPSSSVQGQVGSAATDSPPGEGATRTAQPPPGSVTKPQRPKPSPKTSHSTRVKEPKESVQKQYSAAESSPFQQSEEPNRRNGNVSPVDFVDKLIAVKKRDEAVGIKRKRSTLSSSSSETDFEGAEEYLKKFATSPLNSPLNATEEKSSARKTPHSSRGTSDGSNINLRMDSVSSSSCDSSEHSDSHSPSAARCRIFKKITPHCQLNSVNKGAQLVHTSSNETLKILSEARTNTPPHPSNCYTSSILKGVIAFVEVRSGHDNRSMGVKAQMRILGATVNEKLNKQVTHVVFNEGAPSTLFRARTQGCCLVSVLWIDACKQEKKLVSEKDYPPLNLHLYDSKQTSKKTKYRKMKSLQPDFEEGKSEERLNNYVKKFRRQAQRALASQHTESSTSESSEDEATNSSLKLTRPTCVVPGVKLKTLSVVLTRIDDGKHTNNSTLCSEKRNKRKLMPLRQEIPPSLSVEDFDVAEHTRPEFPYGPASSSKSKLDSFPRRIVKQIPSASQRRRSSCFIHASQSLGRSQSLKKQAKSHMRTMVCTFMHRREIDVVAAVLKQLGGWILEPTVSSKTTHVVCGDSKRTINLLRGIAHGCWILHQEWVMRSLEAGHWLNEEPYELTMFPAIQQNRVARETLGARSEVFSSAGSIFVAKNTTPPRSDLLDLLELCGGSIVKTARQAKIIIGQHQRRASASSAVIVAESWILDCIQENILLPLRRYHL